MGLVIRKTQLRALQAERDRDFVAKVAAYLREAFPDKTNALSDAALHDRIRDAMERCFRYGIETERDVCHFVDYTFRYSPDFDRGWAREILQTYSASAGERLNAVGRELWRLRSESLDAPL
jgi:hypothetical protein